MLPQWLSHRFRDDGDPVFAALTPPDGQLTPLQVEVLDPQHQALGHSKRAAVQQQAHQAMGALKQFQDSRHFLRGQHHRQRGGYSPLGRGPSPSSDRPMTLR